MSRIAHTLAAALFPDPFYQAILIGITHKQKLDVLAEYFRYSIDEAQRIGICTEAGDGESGAALWVLPHPAQVMALEQARKLAFLQTLLQPDGYRNYTAIIDYMDAQVHGRISRNSWYLSILGIAPGVQGRGLGGQLVAPTLAQAEHNATPCYVETFGPRAKTFYERLGFVVVLESAEPVTGETYWVLIR